MGHLNIKGISIEDAKFLRKGLHISLKRDGTLIYWTNGNLISPRGINRNNRFPHIRKALLQYDFPDCMGEMYIEDGTVLDINKKENWKKAMYMPFDYLTSTCMYEERIGRLDTEIDGLNSLFITKPVRFIDLTEAWNFVLENHEEGLVLKGDFNEWYKIKKLTEAKVEIKEWESGKDKGTFILTNGNRISGTSTDFVSQFLKIKENGKKAIAEIEYAFETKDGHYFQPRLRQICEA